MKKIDDAPLSGKDKLKTYRWAMPARLAWDLRLYYKSSLLLHPEVIGGSEQYIPQEVAENAPMSQPQENKRSQSHRYLEQEYESDVPRRIHYLL